MAEIGRIFGDVIANILGNPVVQLTVRLTVAYLIALWLAAAFWTFRDVRQRTRDPISPYLAAGGVVVMTPLLFPFALLAYRVVRPPETLTERATRDLESYVLEATVEHTACPSCGRIVEATWVRCPSCAADLAGTCRSCGGRIDFDWSVCAWCAHDLEPRPTARPAHVAPVIDVPAAAAVLGATSPLLVEPDATPPVADVVRDTAIPGWDPTVLAAPSSVAPTTPPTAPLRGDAAGGAPAGAARDDLGPRPGAIDGWDPTALATSASPTGPSASAGPRPGAIDGWDAPELVIDRRTGGPATDEADAPDGNEVGVPVFGAAASSPWSRRDEPSQDLVSSPPERRPTRR